MTTRPETPPEWTKGRIKSHFGASFQRLHRLRTDMLAAVAPDGDVATLPDALQRIADELTAESEWLTSLMPIPEHLRRSHRAHYLNDYGQRVGRCAETLTVAIDPPFETERWEPFGVALLTLLALGQPSEMARLDKR